MPSTLTQRLNYRLLLTLTGVVLFAAAFVLMLAMFKIKIRFLKAAAKKEKNRSKVQDQTPGQV